MLPTKETQSARVGDLDVPERYRWIPKADVIDVLKLQPGMTIAERNRSGCRRSHPAGL